MRAKVMDWGMEILSSARRAGPDDQIILKLRGAWGAWNGGVPRRESSVRRKRKTAASVLLLRAEFEGVEEAEGGHEGAPPDVDAEFLEDDLAGVFGVIKKGGAKDDDAVDEDKDPDKEPDGDEIASVHGVMVLYQK
jgi:hypothetical protein